MNAKLVTGRFFMERVLPETAAQLARIQAGRGEHDGIAGRDVLTTAHWQEPTACSEMSSPRWFFLR